jgi:virginiamycin B lyase
MSRATISRIAFLAFAVIVLLCASVSRAADQPGVLQGVVKSSSGEPLSGAYVKVINLDKRITFLVVTQAQGLYTANDLPPGKYTVQGIGNGFQSMPTPATVAAAKPTTTDVSLTAHQPAQLPNGWPGYPGKVAGAEFWMKYPSPPLPDGPGKEILETKCKQCHELWRVVLLKFNEPKWKVTIERMREHIQDAGAIDITDEEEKTIVAYLSKNYTGLPGTANARPDPNSRLPLTLASGAGAKYRVVDLDIPTPDAKPHDITVDTSGNGWIVEDIGCCLDKFDPKTFAYIHYVPPAGKKKTVLATPIIQGSGDLLWFIDENNRRWFTVNSKTMEYKAYPMPDSIKGPVGSNSMAYDRKSGNVWAGGIGSNQIFRLDPKTGHFDAFPIPSYAKTHKNSLPYGVAVSGDGALWFAERDVNLIGRVDPLTGKVDEYPSPGVTPIPRRMTSDQLGNIYIGMHETGDIVKIDYETRKMTSYTPPTKNESPYGFSADLKNGYVWFSEQASDKLARFDPKTETFVEFALPNAETDIRRIEVDQNRPNRVWWTGDTANHMGYLEVLN